MAELKAVLGAILVDIAKARVASDICTRDVSLEYAKDPILSEFPVPRVEIKEASIELKFAINEVKKLEDNGGNDGGNNGDDDDNNGNEERNDNGDENEDGLESLRIKSIVDVAVTKEELVYIPERVTSQIKIVTEIRNYELNEVEEIDKKIVRRLQPE